MIACLKHALKIDGVIESDLVAAGTPGLTGAQKKVFAAHYERIKEGLRQAAAAPWRTRLE
jgi:hypothetical protein